MAEGKCLFSNAMLSCTFVVVVIVLLSHEYKRVPQVKPTQILVTLHHQ